MSWLKSILRFRWFRFSLRTLLLGTALAAMVFAVLGWKWQRAQRQYNAAIALMEQGDGVAVPDGSNNGVEVFQTLEFDSFVPKNACDRMFWRVTSVNVNFERISRSLSLLKELPYLRRVTVEYPAAKSDDIHQRAEQAARRAREALPGVTIDLELDLVYLGTLPD